MGNSLDRALLKGAAFCFLLGLTACTPSAQNSLVSDKASVGDSHAVNKDPSAEELYIKTDSPTVIGTSLETRADISGECFASSYPSHKIYVLNSNDVRIAIRNIASVQNPLDSSAASCSHGRFNIGVDTTGWAAGAYTLKLRIVGVDASGAEHVNDSQGYSSFTLTR